VQIKLVQIAQESKGDPAIQAEFAVSRFLWVFIDHWHDSKIRSRNLGEGFWAKQRPALEEFDKKFPGQFRAPGTGPAHRTELPKDPPVGVMIASNMRPPPSPSPRPPPSKTGPKTPPPPTPAQRRLPIPYPIPKKCRQVPPLSPTPTPGPSQARNLTSPLSATSIDEGEPEPAPAPADKKKEKKQGPVEVSGRIRRPIDVKGKGKQKEEIESSEDSEDEQPAPAPESRKKEKAKVQVREKERKKEVIEERPQTQGEYTRPEPKSNGVVRKPQCERCVVSKRVCYEQAGYGKSCYWCAHLKMRCVAAATENSEKKKGKVRVIQPAEDPAPGPSKKPATKRRPAPVSSPVPAKKRKVTITASMVASSDSERENGGQGRQGGDLTNWERAEGEFFLFILQI
jgi:hypothetical protein